MKVATDGDKLSKTYRLLAAVVLLAIVPQVLSRNVHSRH